MEILIIILIFAVFIGLIILLFRFAMKHNKKRIRLNEDFAKRLGLNHSFKKMAMSGSTNKIDGQIDGQMVCIYEKMIGAGKHRQLASRIIVEGAPFDFEFKIGKEHFFSKAGKMIGFKDVEVNDPAFDGEFLLKSKSPDKLKILMNYEMQSELKNISDDLKGSINASKGQVVYLPYHAFSKEEHFEEAERVLRFMLKLTNQKT